MFIVRISNPALRNDTFTSVQRMAGEQAMTIQGTVNRTGILPAILVIVAALVMSLLWAGAIGGFVVAMVTAFKKEWAPLTTPIYAVCEGLFLGAVSLLFNQQSPDPSIAQGGSGFPLMCSAR